jgi:hypothetical protein
MSYQFHATCECGYKSETLFANTCVCRICRELVDARRLPFRYELTPCPKCNSPMFENDTLLEIFGKGWLVSNRQSSVTCPKCENAKLFFHLDAHLHLVRGIDFPRVGDEIDGCIKRNGKLDIPWFTLDSATVTHDIPSNIQPNQRVTLRVIAINTAKPTGTVQSMFYRYVVTQLELQYVATLLQNRR